MTGRRRRIQVEALDHLVLTVLDVEDSAAFYETVLGMERVVFGEGRTALRFGHQKINLHAAGEEVSPHARLPTPGSADLCFLTGAPTRGIIEHLERHELSVELGPVHRQGARDAIRSTYLRDPDGNLIEIARPVRCEEDGTGSEGPAPGAGVIEGSQSAR